MTCADCGEPLSFGDTYCLRCARQGRPLAAPAADNEHPCRVCVELPFCPDAATWASECRLRDDDVALAELDAEWLEAHNDWTEVQERRRAAQNGTL